MDKKTLRREYLRIRAGIPGFARMKADEAISIAVQNLPEYRNASVISGYVTDGTEPDVLPILRHALKRGVRTCLPKWNGTEYILSLVEESDLSRLSPGKWGIMEPLSTRPANEVIQQAGGVLYLVPGVAFDESFNRLGRGGGIYDRILNGRGCAVALGVFYECQQFLMLPTEDHDAKLDIIVTESGIRRCKQRDARSAS